MINSIQSWDEAEVVINKLQDEIKNIRNKFKYQAQKKYYNKKKDDILKKRSEKSHRCEPCCGLFTYNGLRTHKNSLKHKNKIGVL